MRVRSFVELDGRNVTNRAVVGARTRYGRDRVKDAPDPASCTVELLQLAVDAPVPVSAGMGLQLGIVLPSGARVVRFAGTVTDVDVDLTPGDRVRRLVAVSNGLGRMARRTVGDEPWGQETVGARIARVGELAGVTVVVKGDDLVEVAGQDVDRQGALGLVQGYATSGDYVLAEFPTSERVVELHTPEYRRTPGGTGQAPELVDGDALTNPAKWATAGYGYAYPGVDAVTPAAAGMALSWNPAPVQAPQAGRMAGVYVALVEGHRYELVVDLAGDDVGPPVRACVGWYRSAEEYVDVDAPGSTRMTFVAPATEGRLVGLETHPADGTVGAVTVAGISCREVVDPGRGMNLPANVVQVGAVAEQRVETLTNRARVRWGPPDAQGEVLAQDAPSIDRWGEYEDSLTTTLATVAAASERASRLVALGRAPAWQFVGLVVDLGLDTVDDALAEQLLALRIGDRVNLTGVDADASPATYLEGWADELDGVDHYRIVLDVSESSLTTPAPRWVDVHPETRWVDVPPGMSWIGAAVGPLQERATT